jgi:hypothetical protein
MHFFNPVHRMPLVEIIRGKKSSEKAVAQGVQYAVQMGKTPIVVNDCPGFLVNRVLFPYFNGFLFLLEDGVDFQKIDKVMEKWGWPMGPAYLLDVVGIDTGHHASHIMATEFPDRMGFKGKNVMESMFDHKRLLYYRDNWYLDAWCHKQHALRSFSLARIDHIIQTENNQPAHIVPRQEREEHFSGSYGIFAGKGVHTATLRFQKAIAREISMQQWHPKQVGRWDGDDYVLSFQYNDERELVRDLMRYVPELIVESPLSLRRSLISRLQDGLNVLQKP